MNCRVDRLAIGQECTPDVGGASKNLEKRSASPYEHRRDKREEDVFEPVPDKKSCTVVVATKPLLADEMDM